MSMLRKVGIGVGGLLGVLVVVGAGGYGWSSMTTTTKLTAKHDVHRIDFPIPFPLTDDEVTALRAERSALAKSPAMRGKDVMAGVDLAAIANERAVARGKHLVQSFYGCTECHGADFGGGTMVDDPMIGRLLAPNLTLGTGSRTLKYAAADWDRMVRHGVKPDSSGSPMPSKDFFAVTDRELSDVVSYIRSFPPVNKEVPAISLGPLGKFLVAAGKIPLSADIHPTNHVITHAVLPPAASADATFGKHLAQTCTGCHGPTLAGGPILGGPPDWPPARNLTPTGLAGWTYQDFLTALKEGKSKNGVALREPMASMPKFAKNMTDVELQALWAYISTVPPQPIVK